MRLWHKDLIPYLPKKQLQGQWKELFQIKGSINKRNTPNHLLVNKVLDYDIIHFKHYALQVYIEGEKRNIAFKESKLDEMYYWQHTSFINKKTNITLYENWHNDRYLKQCLFNLQEKYDCGGISQEEWEVIENAFSKYL